MRMLSRRAFMWAMPGSGLLAPIVRAQSVPPSIAALQSLAGQARPFTNQEREIRLERARKLMAAEKIEAIVLSGGASPLYFANVQFGGGERLWALVIPVKANPFIVCPAFEEDRAHELLADTPFAHDAEVRTWEEDE